ncbi:MAG: deoxyhypusine synthase family protein [Nanoarchaeota archaeon]|nr:deoxyhypusine synthase family protein [Nanoarchaeota archaeon]
MRTELRDGYSDGFVPLNALDLSKINNFSDMAKAMSFTSLTARRIGEATDTIYKMTTNKDCFTILTLSGIMTVAKMGLVLCDMIESGMVDAVVSTGALMTHGFVEGSGMEHFKYEFGMMDDMKLYQGGYNRVYDTLELESNLDNAELIINEMLQDLDATKPTCSREILENLGKHLIKNTKGRGVVKTAFHHKVPIYIPAFTDSEMGLDFSIYNKKRLMKGKQPIPFDPFLDLDHFTDLVKDKKEIGIITIGGGVPRNWAQQIGPYVDVMNKRLKKNMNTVRYKYGVRICPEPVHWGGLSGCTYSEGVSWGKFVPEREGGKQVEVLSEATAVLPLIIKAVLERLEKDKK